LIGKNNYLLEVNLVKITFFAVVFLLSGYFSSHHERVIILLFGSVQVVSMFTDLGINNGFLRHLAKIFSKRDSNLYRVEYLKCRGFYRIAAIPVSIIMFLYSYLLIGGKTDFYWLAAIYGLILYLNKPFDLKMKSENQFKKLNLIEFFSFSGIALFLILITLHHESLTFLIFAFSMVLFSIVMTLLKFYFSKSFDRKKVCINDLYAVKKVISISIPIALFSISIQIIPNSIIPFIAATLDPIDAATLIFLFRVVTTIDSLTWADFYGQIPKWYGVLNYSEKIDNELKLRSLKVLLKFSLLNIIVFFIISLKDIQMILNVNVDMEIYISIFLWFLVSRLYSMDIQRRLISSNLKFIWIILSIPIIFIYGLLSSLDIAVIFLSSALICILIYFYDINKKTFI